MASSIKKASASAVYDRVPPRPLIHYHGSKFKLAGWIISFFPEHRIFLDLFGGSASVLLKKPRSEIEVYNDLDGEIVNLLKVARDRGEELFQKLYLTPYARDEFRASFRPSGDPLEQARRTVVRSFQGFGGALSTTTGQKSKASIGSFRIAYKHGNLPQVSWASVPDNLLIASERLRGVCIENLDFRKALKRYSQRDALVYADPPYLPDVRDYGNDYRHELTEQDHIDLAKLLNERGGPAAVSGYRSELYEDLYKGWARRERAARCVSHKERIEVIWIKGFKGRQGELF
jgi:DNA adenine methylase